MKHIILATTAVVAVAACAPRVQQICSDEYVDKLNPSVTTCVDVAIEYARPVFVDRGPRNDDPKPPTQSFPPVTTTPPDDEPPADDPPADDPPADDPPADDPPADDPPADDPPEHPRGGCDTGNCGIGVGNGGGDGTSNEGGGQGQGNNTGNDSDDDGVNDQQDDD